MSDEEVPTAVEGRDVEGPGRTRVVLLGSGEPGRELVIALQRLGVEVITPVVDPTDTGQLAATIRRLQPTVVVSATDLGSAADTGVEAVPSAGAARLTADPERLRRLAADELGLPTAPFWFAGSVDELRSIAEHAGFPMVVKPASGSSLGEGRSVMVRPDDIEPAWQRAASAAGVGSPARVLAETVVEVDSEVTLLAVCSDGPAGPSLDFCAPIGHRGIESPNGQLVLESWQPHPLSPAALDAAKSVAARMVRSLGGRGLFGVELLIRGDEVYFSDVAVRPYDTALLTARTQRLSVFDLQARAILGLPADTIMVSPGAARLVYSRRQAAAAPEADQPDIVAVLTDALNVAESDAMLFGRHGDGPRRRLGVAMATASDVAAARERARQVSTVLGKLWP